MTGENLILIIDEQNEKSLVETVDRSCREIIKTRFDVLLSHQKLKQSDLAKLLSVDKAYVSRMVNGFQIPPKGMMIKVAQVLKTDSRVIWE